MATIDKEWGIGADKESTAEVIPESIEAKTSPDSRPHDTEMYCKRSSHALALYLV